MTCRPPAPGRPAGILDFFDFFQDVPKSVPGALGGPGGALGGPWGGPGGPWGALGALGPWGPWGPYFPLRDAGNIFIVDVAISRSGSSWDRRHLSAEGRHGPPSPLEPWGALGGPWGPWGPWGALGAQGALGPPGPYPNWAHIRYI